MESNLESALAIFRNAVDALHPLPNADFERLAQVLHYRKYKKGEVVLQEGNVCRGFWFILKGCFRIYSVKNGEDVNVRFFFEQNFAADFISLRHEIPSNFNIVAFEDTESLYSIKTDYRPVLNFSKSLLKLTATFFSYHFFEEIEHSNSFKLMSPEERYHNLVLTRPNYIQRIPLTYLASYLGMSRKTLTRIRKS